MKKQMIKNSKIISQIHRLYFCFGPRIRFPSKSSLSDTHTYKHTIDQSTLAPSER